MREVVDRTLFFMGQSNLGGIKAIKKIEESRS